MCLANSITVVAQSLANSALPTFISAVRVRVRARARVRVSTTSTRCRTITIDMRTTNTTSEATARKAGRAIRREHGVREVDDRETGTLTGKCNSDPLKCCGHEIDVLQARTVV